MKSCKKVLHHCY